MIIECINCLKKFDVKSELIPSEGRTIQCGSCNHVWFFDKNKEIPSQYPNKEQFKNYNISSNENTSKKKDESIGKKNNKNKNTINQNVRNKDYELVKYQSKTHFTFSKFLSIVLVLIISFIAFIIILDTFKTPLYNFFPNLEFILFNLYETLKDIELFIRDLVKYD